MAWYQLGQALEHESRGSQAIAAWRQTIAVDPDNTQALWSLARALRPTDSAEADRLMARFAAIQRDHRVVDRVETLANDAAASAQAQEWSEAVRQLKQAFEACGECNIKPQLHKKLGLIYCHAGDLENGEKELRLARAGLPGDAEIERALALISRARTHASAQAVPVR